MPHCCDAVCVGASNRFKSRRDRWRVCARTRRPRRFESLFFFLSLARANYSMHANTTPTNRTRTTQRSFRSTSFSSASMLFAHVGPIFERRYSIYAVTHRRSDYFLSLIIVHRRSSFVIDRSIGVGRSTVRATASFCPSRRTQHATYGYD
jgi:hypothetical protein